MTIWSDAYESAIATDEPVQVPLKPFMDDRGWSLMNICVTDLSPEGQINFSHVNAGCIKAWHRHLLQTDLWVVTNGDMICVCYNQDEDEAKKFMLGEHRPSALVIPPGWWHGLRVIGDGPVDMFYYVTKKYNVEKPDEERMPFTWEDPERMLGNWREVDYK